MFIAKPVSKNFYHSFTEKKKPKKQKHSAQTNRIIIVFWGVDYNIPTEKSTYCSYTAQLIFTNGTKSYNRYLDQETEHYIHPRSPISVPIQLYPGF